MSRYNIKPNITPRRALHEVKAKPLKQTTQTAHTVHKPAILNAVGKLACVAVSLANASAQFFVSTKIGGDLYWSADQEDRIRNLSNLTGFRDNAIAPDGIYTGWFIQDGCKNDSSITHRCADIGFASATRVQIKSEWATTIVAGAAVVSAVAVGLCIATAVTCKKLRDARADFAELRNYTFSRRPVNPAISDVPSLQEDGVVTMI